MRLLAFLLLVACNTDINSLPTVDGLQITDLGKVDGMPAFSNILEYGSLQDCNGSTTLYSDIIAKPCPTCSCMPLNCTASVSSYSEATCANFSRQNSIVLPVGSTKDLTVSALDYVLLTSLVGSCNTSFSMTAPIFDSTQAHLCKDTQCNTAQCILDKAQCITTLGQDDCPNPFKNKGLWYKTVTDTRVCDCGCSTTCSTTGFPCPLYLSTSFGGQCVRTTCDYIANITTPTNVHVTNSIMPQCTPTPSSTGSIIPSDMVRLCCK